MCIFANLESHHALGRVQGVDTARVNIKVNFPEQLSLVRVGRLVGVQGRDANEWLIGIVTRIWRRPSSDEPAPADYLNDHTLPLPIDENIVQCILVGTYSALKGSKKDQFTRALLAFPDVDRRAYSIEGRLLEQLMSIISALNTQSAEQKLKLGTYSLEEKAVAQVDADKLFQRHVAVLGTTGSGKSWAVANILEQIKELACPNVIVFDVHGEYRNLPYAHQLRIAGAADIGQPHADDVLYLPYWLLSFEEMLAIFVDRSEQSAPNQTMALLDSVIKLKNEFLAITGKADLQASLTVDSPIPFANHALIEEIKTLDSQMVEGKSGPKQGPWFGKLTPMRLRMDSRLKDRRYGFLLQPTAEYLQYDALEKLAIKLLGYKGIFGYQKSGIKVIDLSEVPSDILPVIVSLIARLVSQVQFWLEVGNENGPADRHPLLFVCDEAHTYLPASLREVAGIERRALENFEKIAKEGRKYGIGLMIVSQRPSDVSMTILSQCNNIMALRLTNEQDKAVVKSLLPDSLDGLLEALPGLEVGEAIVVGDAVLLPSRIQLGKPKHEPNSNSLDFWTCWATQSTPHDISAAVESLRRQRRVKASTPNAPIPPTTSGIA